jgi:hypothetical protein
MPATSAQKHSFIQNAIIVAISDPSFVFALPELRQSTWDYLKRSDANCERERLEFVGDALMHTCVALELYEQFPKATPGLYSVCFFITHTFSVIYSNPLAT